MENLEHSRKNEPYLDRAYAEFQADTTYKQKSYVNFLSYMKKNDQAHYHGYSAAEVGEAFSVLKETYAQNPVPVSSELVIEQPKKRNMFLRSMKKVAAAISAVLVLSATKASDTKSSSDTQPLDDIYNIDIAKTPIYNIELVSDPDVFPGKDTIGGNPTIYDTPVKAGNLQDIQARAKADLETKNALQAKKQLEANVKTTAAERTYIQNLTNAYMLHNKMCPLGEEDIAKMSKLIPDLQIQGNMVNASQLYQKLLSIVSKESTFELNLPASDPQSVKQTKVVYLWTYLMKKFGYDKNSNGNARIFITDDGKITNDYCVAIMEFQNACGISRDATAGAKTTAHALYRLNSKINSSVNSPKLSSDSLQSNNEKINPKQSSPSSSSQDTTKTHLPLTHSQDTSHTIVKNIDIIDQAKAVLNEFLTGNELGFVKGLDEFLENSSSSEDAKNTLVRSIIAISQSSDSKEIKKGLILNVLSEQGVINSEFGGSKINVEPITPKSDDAIKVGAVLDSVKVADKAIILPSSGITKIDSAEGKKIEKATIADLDSVISVENITAHKDSTITSETFNQSGEVDNEQFIPQVFVNGKSTTSDSIIAEPVTKIASDSAKIIAEPIIKKIAEPEKVVKAPEIVSDTAKVRNILTPLLRNAEMGYVESIIQYINQSHDQDFLKKLEDINNSNDNEYIKRALIFNLLREYNLKNQKMVKVDAAGKSTGDASQTNSQQDLIANLL